MPLSWNEIKDRALAFSRDWADASDERAQAQGFWIEFFNIFGVSSRRVASFEEPVRKLGDRRGFIDLFWKGVLIAEHKSRGRNLDRAHQQALDYFPGIAERDLPRYVLVSDVARLRLHDLDTGDDQEFPLADLHKHVGLFAFVAGYSTQKLAPEDPVNRKAAERMGRLHDRLKASGFQGHALEVLLVRLLFCLFAEDTGIVQPRKAFQDWIENRTAPDGSNLGALLAQCFQVLNTPEDRRSTALDEQLAAFPYVNGKLFEEHLPIADFDSGMREAVLDTRATFPDASLADLYDPLTMPPTLVKAHQALHRAVDAAYVPSGGKRSWASDAERVAFLFGLYQRLTSLLPTTPVRAARTRRATR